MLTTALANSRVACKVDEAAQYLTAYKQSEHCERVFKTPGWASEMLRMSLTRLDPLARHRPPTPCSLSSSPKLRAPSDSAGRVQAALPRMMRNGCWCERILWLELDLNSPFPDPAPARDDASSKRGCEERVWDTELNKTAALGNVWHGRRLASIDLVTSPILIIRFLSVDVKPTLPPASPNEDTGVSRLLNFKFRKEMTLIPRTCQSTRSPPQESTTLRRSRDRMAGSFLPNARPLAHYAGDTLCRELRDDGAGGIQAQSRGKVTVFVLNMIEPGAGLECCDTPEVPPSHNLTASLPLRGVMNIAVGLVGF
ncbi:hypothetical protein EDB86DRAFT_3076959 [Lactarius hatsudake]|nr:hypothetical protein EDB86DRAFT_3076959 [Lactarius hatsudake]